MRKGGDRGEGEGQGRPRQQIQQDRRGGGFSGMLNDIAGARLDRAHADKRSIRQPGKADPAAGQRQEPPAALKLARFRGLAIDSALQQNNIFSPSHDAQAGGAAAGDWRPITQTSLDRLTGTCGADRRFAPVDLAAKPGAGGNTKSSCRVLGPRAK